VQTLVVVLGVGRQNRQVIVFAMNMLNFHMNYVAHENPPTSSDSGGIGIDGLSCT
jgi:hypothetical protein